MARRASAAAPVSARPSTRTSPAVGRMSPARSRRSVLFPAPFGPATASASPGTSVRSMSWRTLTRPNERRRPRAASSGSPSQEGIDPRAEFVEAERFDDVAGVGEIQNLELGLDAHVGGRDDDRQVGLAQPDAAEELDPVGIGEPHVQHRHVGALLLELLHRLRARGGEHQIVSRLERSLVAESQRGLVLDDQDAPAALCLRHATYPAPRRPTAAMEGDGQPAGYTNGLPGSRPY